MPQRVLLKMTGSSKNMAEAGTVSPALAYWIPNTLIAAAVAAVIYLKGREIHLGVADRLIAWYDWLKDRLKSAGNG